MARKVITIANHKGGVGKTTSVVNIACQLARLGYKTLALDLDAQGNLTYNLLGNADTDGATIYDALTGKASALPIVPAGKVFNLFVVPSSVELAQVEPILATIPHRETLLKRLLAPVLDAYDYILIDTPPSLGALTINALSSATDLYVPLTGEALPLQGLAVLEQLIDVTRRATGTGAPLSGIFFTRYNNRRLNAFIAKSIATKYGGIVFATKIRENIALAEAPLTGQAIYDYAPTSNGAKDYQQLTEEIIKRG